MKKPIFIYSISLIMGICACDSFDEINTNPYQISDESLKQNLNHVGAYYPTMLGNIFAGQIEHNLVHDSFVRQLGTPTPFVNGVNNTTYYITWNNYWSHVYNNIMAPSKQVIEIAEKDQLDVFVAWAKLIRVLAVSRLAAYHGPVIYSNYGKPGQTTLYDSEKDLYNNLFTDLDTISSVFNNNKDYEGLKKFDASYGGDVKQWAKLANSLRLRLAIRLSKVAPKLARKQGEKALESPETLITKNADNFYISLYGKLFPPAMICFDWGDTRMSATMESILIGYKDNRIEKYFDPATDPAVYADHPESPYKGIRNGAVLAAKDERLSYSTIDESFKTITRRRCVAAAEIHFLMAEAALRNWKNAGNAKDHYENGVRISFEEWKASGVNTYLNDDNSLPLDYKDPKAEGDINSFKNRIQSTVKWDENASKEVKLEKILTQKWIAGFMNSIEAWVDHRRTGYPKLPYNYKNDSNQDYGIIPKNEFLKRMPFVQNEYENNPQGVRDATAKLGGPDEIGTRLWWDTGTPNF